MRVEVDFEGGKLDRVAGWYDLYCSYDCRAVFVRVCRACAWRGIARAADCGMTGVLICMACTADL
jgi:hypothetical protein